MPSDEITCDACFTYNHPYLTACVGCGRPRSSSYPEAIYEWVHGDEHLTHSEAIALVREWWPDVPTDSSLVQQEMEPTRWERRAVRAESMWKGMPRPVPVDELIEQRRAAGRDPFEFEDRAEMEKLYQRGLDQYETGRPFRAQLDNTLVRQQPYRYQGGLYGHPYEGRCRLAGNRFGVSGTRQQGWHGTDLDRICLRTSGHLLEPRAR